MFCRECGNKLTGEEDFCPMCGTKVMPFSSDHEEVTGEEDDSISARTSFGSDPGMENHNHDKPMDGYSNHTGWSDEAAHNERENEHLGHPPDEHEREHKTEDQFHPGNGPLYAQSQPDPHLAESQNKHDPIPGNSEHTPHGQVSAPSKPKRKITKKQAILAFGIPAASLLIFSGSAIAIHSSEKNTNQRAEALHYEGEEYALDGNYDQAVKKLNEASELRPGNSVITRVKREVESASKVDKTLTAVDEKIDSKEFGEAKDTLTSVRNDIQTRKSPIFAPLETRTSKQETDLIIEMVKYDTQEMDSVKEIGVELEKIKDLESAEAKEVKGKLIDKIVELSKNTSDKHMEKENFDKAIDALREAQRYTNYENEELITRLNELENARASYKGSLPVFLEENMAVLDSKAMKSKNPPLKLGKLIFQEDQFTYVVTGSIKNTTKITLNNPQLYIKIYNKKGKFLYNDTVSSKDVAIKAGKEAEFFFFLDKDYGKDIKVVIDQVTYIK
ncbi:hypothetical protein [Metabacillus sp. 84]|uniref:hypothetical protein n=1 Tax=Metabacillus sp. 84 TaxID=3404705 RepID=UPI003CF77638